MSEKIYSLLDSFMYSFNTYLLSQSQVLGTILGSKGLVMNKTDDSQFLRNLQSSGHRQQTNMQV